MISRRDFVKGIGVAAPTLLPRTARAQQRPLPVIGYVGPGSRETAGLGPFLEGLREAGFVEGRNLTIEYRWAEGHYDRLPALAADLVDRRVAVIIAGNSTAALAAKAATATIPIVFVVGDDPVRLGLVASLARPGGNATGINFFSVEAVSKRLGLLHELAPKADRVALLLNPASVGSAGTLREAQEAACRIGLPIDILKASSSQEIEEAFATMARQRIEALLIAADSYFRIRFLQLATLAVRHGIASSYSDRRFVEVGGLTSYGPDFVESVRQVGVYAGRILKGAGPADLAVVQSTKFEFAINMQTARAIGISVSPGLLSSADVVIE